MGGYIGKIDPDFWPEFFKRLGWVREPALSLGVGDAGYLISGRGPLVTLAPWERGR